MIFPAEAVNAMSLLWNYYLVHVFLLILLIWPAYAFFKMKCAIRWSGAMLVLVFVVEGLQNRYPKLGDASLDDIVIGFITVIIFSALLIPVKMNLRIIREDKREE